MAKLDHYTHEPKNGNKPKQIIMLLHGYGDSGLGLITLAPYFQDAAPDALFLSPDAPFPCEEGIGRQWFSLRNYNPETLLEGAKQATPILNDYIDEVLAQYGLTDQELILVGFSQGTMMSLYAGPRRKTTMAGILGYSGALIGAEDLNEHNKPPIHLIHGESDEVVTIDRYHDAVTNLAQNGFDISGHSTPGLEHSIDEEGLKSGASFLAKIVNEIK